MDDSILVPIHQDVANMDSIYTLNSLGAFIWEQLDHPATQGALQSAILGEYDADPDVLSADIHRFLREMTTIGALREV
jgi:hypothetical protein